MRLGCTYMVGMLNVSVHFTPSTFQMEGIAKDKFSEMLEMEHVILSLFCFEMDLVRDPLLMNTE